MTGKSAGNSVFAGVGRALVRAVDLVLLFDCAAFGAPVFCAASKPAAIAKRKQQDRRILSERMKRSLRKESGKVWQTKSFNAEDAGEHARRLAVVNCCACGKLRMERVESLRSRGR